MEKRYVYDELTVQPMSNTVRQILGGWSSTHHACSDNHQLIVQLNLLWGGMVFSFQFSSFSTAGVYMYTSEPTTMLTIANLNAMFSYTHACICLIAGLNSDYTKTHVCAGGWLPPAKNYHMYICTCLSRPYCIFFALAVDIIVRL